MEAHISKDPISVEQIRAEMTFQDILERMGVPISFKAGETIIESNEKQVFVLPLQHMSTRNIAETFSIPTKR